MKRILCWVYVFSYLMLFAPLYSYAEVVIQEGLRIEIGRVLHGVTSGKQYLGYTGGTITLPHSPRRNAVILAVE